MCEKEKIAYKDKRWAFKSDLKCKTTLQFFRVSLCVLQSAKIWHLSPSLYSSRFLKSCVCVFVDDTFSSAFRAFCFANVAAFLPSFAKFSVSLFSERTHHLIPIPCHSLSLLMLNVNSVIYSFVLLFCKSKEHAAAPKPHISCRLSFVVRSFARTHNFSSFGVESCKEPSPSRLCMPITKRQQTPKFRHSK